jgi:hypothetical protein
MQAAKEAAQRDLAGLNFKLEITASDAQAQVRDSSPLGKLKKMPGVTFSHCSEKCFKQCHMRMEKNSICLPRDKDCTLPPNISATMCSLPAVRSCSP